jgi:hypothetical protein
MELTLARAPTEEIMLWASPPCNAGKRRHWDYPVLGLLQTPVEVVRQEVWCAAGG